MTDIERIREFYRQQAYKSSVQPSDVFIGATLGASLVGVVRITAEQGTHVLRGMRVKPGFQGQGIGTKMLHEIKNVLGAHECFAVAYAHLKRFYGQIGFSCIDELDAPRFLRERIETYRKENRQQQFILVGRPATSSSSTR